MPGLFRLHPMHRRTVRCFSWLQPTARRSVSRWPNPEGGTLARATSQTQNGREVCVVVVLIPGKDGERPRRVEVAVPAN